MTKVKKKHDAEELERARKRVRELLRKEFSVGANFTIEERKELNRLAKYCEKHRPKNSEMIAGLRAKTKRPKGRFNVWGI